MSTKSTPGGAQPATPSEQPQAVAVSDACLHGFYYLGQPNGDRFQVVRLNDDGSIAVKAPGGAQVVRLDKRHVLYAAPTSVEADDAARSPAPRASASLAPVDLPDGLRGTPKPNPGGHLDRARIEEALPTMTEEQLTELLDHDRRTFVGSLVNNERERRERAAKAPSKIEWTDAAPPRSPSVSATPSASPPRGMTVASAPPSYPSTPAPPKTPRAPKAAPTPPAAPAPAASLSPPNDDQAARARAAWAVLSKNAAALIECAAAYKELEALGLTATRFM